MHSTINQLLIQLISLNLDLFFPKNVEKLHFGFRGGKNIFGFRVLISDGLNTRNRGVIAQIE